MPNIIDHIQVGNVTYDIHDARITGNALNFKGVTDTAGWPVDQTPLTASELAEYTEGDVIINTLSGKEFVVANTGSTATPTYK